MGLIDILIWKEILTVADKEIEQETIKEGKANLWYGLESVGGKLFLTNEHLIHYAHAINFRMKRKIATISLKDVLKVEKVNTMGIVPNGMKVITKEKNYQFVVNGRSQWIDEINKMID